MQKTLSKICILADTHGLYDDRIYWKEAISLKNAGYEVVYILAGEKDESGKTDEGIYYRKIKRDLYPGNRFLNYFAKRFFKKGLYKQMFKIAAQEKASVYHYHDLRINQIAAGLKKLPFHPRVIYDVHEPYPENILDYFSGGFFSGLFNKIYAFYIRNWELRTAAVSDLIVTTEENMQRRFKNYFPDKAVEIIYNYTNLSIKNTPASVKNYDAIYTGGITARRGALKILEAVKLAKDKMPKIKVLFLGSWFPQNLKTEMLDFIDKNGLNKNVDLIDSVPYAEIEKYYRQSKIGLGIFLPIPTHRIILQIKIFEYLNFGLPIVGSYFGHIHTIIQKHNCGISVNPESPQEISDALLALLSDDNLYKKMSKNAKQAVVENYRWEKMETKLLDIYKELLEEYRS